MLARFGSEGRRIHELARGIDPGPSVLVAPPPDLVERTELDPPAERVDIAAFAAKELADRLLERLAERGLACTRVLVEAETEHGERLTRCWRHARSELGDALTPGVLAERVRWQLDAWINTGETTAGITSLALIPDEVVPADGRQLGFWGGDQVAHQRADRALARVQGMLGYDAVTTAVVQGGRTPAEQVRWVPWGEPREPERPLAVGTEVAAWPGALPPPFPARVFDPPLPAELVDAAGDAIAVNGRGEQLRPPAHVRCRGAPGRWWRGARVGGTVGARRALVGRAHAPPVRALATGASDDVALHRGRRRWTSGRRSDLRLTTVRSRSRLTTTDNDPEPAVYAELHCHSNFSFLDGASHPEELAEEAARLGLAALAITDHDGFYGVVRFAEAARPLGLPTVFGAELTLGARAAARTGWPIRRAST